MTPEYGVCSVCRRGRALCRDRTVGAHQRLHPAGYSMGRCSGTWEPALAILPGKPANRMDVFLEPGAVMPLTQNDPGQPDLPATLQEQLEAADRAALKVLETLAPAVNQAIQAMLPVFARMAETLDKANENLEAIGKQLATANRRDRTR